MKVPFEFLIMAGVLSASEPWEKSLGTWREVPNQASAIRAKVESDPPKMKISECNADGICGGHPVTFEYDGKKYKGPEDWHTDFSFRKIDDHTVEEKDSVEGKDDLRETDLWTIAGDGRTMTQKVTYPPSDHAKNPISVTRFYNRYSDNPRSAADPFVGYWVEDHTKVSPREEFTISAKGENTIEVTIANGSTWQLTFDGKDHPSYGNPGCETVNAQFVDSRTCVRKCINAGKVTWTATDKFSDDWKTHSTSVVDASGEVSPTATFEKVK